MEQIVYVTDRESTITTLGKVENLSDSATLQQDAYFPVFPIDYQPINASLYITNSCNFNCSYCYIIKHYKSNRKFLSFDDWKNVILDLYKNGVRKLKFIGGEPFLYKELSSLIEFADKCGYLGIHISTNGSIDVIKHNIKTINILSQIKATYSFSVSFDSADKECHNALRGGYDSVIEGIQFLVRLGCKVSMAAVVTEKNKNHIREMLLKAIELGVDSYQFNSLVPMSKNQIDLALTDKVELERINNLLTELSSEFYGHIRIENRILPQANIHPEVHRKYQSIPQICESSLVACAAARRDVYVLPDGSLIPCPMFIQMDNFYSDETMPSVPFKELWERDKKISFFRKIVSKEIPKECRIKCDFHQLCKGGCRALNYFTCGTFDEPDPRCLFMNQ